MLRSGRARGVSSRPIRAEGKDGGRLKMVCVLCTSRSRVARICNPETLGTNRPAAKRSGAFSFLAFPLEVAVDLSAALFENPALAFVGLFHPGLE